MHITFRYELMARIENHGPFHFFFTLSCADKLFTENFISNLASENCKIEYYFKHGKEYVNVNGIPLDDYMKENMDQYDFVKKNFVNSTLNFQQRLKNFIKHILMAPSSPLKIKYYGYKVKTQIFKCCLAYIILPNPIKNTLKI